jgi:hypothetical protein
MKKFLVLASMATLLTAGSAFAAKGTIARPDATFQFGVGGAASGPTTTNNDDSCDIGVTPAATLLLPYFEVDFNSPQTTAQTTLFTITNTSYLPQIAKVTLWSDWSFPVLDFNIFLTGYDVQGINLYDIIQRGIIAPSTGTSVTTTAGGLSAPNYPNGPVVSGNTQTLSNPNFIYGPGGVTASCAGLPGAIPSNLVADVRSALTTGVISTCPSNRVGGVHANAVGYATIDVVANCTTNLPTSAAYYTSEILFDNVLIGDYQQINPNPATGNYAGGNPLVHIRAIPEGGPAGSIPVGVTNLPFTFYSRYSAATLTLNIDRRQPLPSTFAARYIQGGTGNFNTNYKIWREGRTAGSPTCANAITNGSIAIGEIVRFDEHENFNTFSPGVVISPSVPATVTLPETSATSTSSTIFPPLTTSGDVAGWMYLNLNSSQAATGASRPGFNVIQAAVINPRPSQNWVIVSQFAEGRYSVDFDAAWLGNGCSAAASNSTANGGSVPIGPSGGVPVCPVGLTCTAPAGTVGYTGTNVTP